MSIPPLSGRAILNGSPPSRTAEYTGWRDITKLLILFALWYMFSTGSNIFGKLTLDIFPYPMSITMIQLLCIVFFLTPICFLWVTEETRSRSCFNRTAFTLVLPLAAWKFITSTLSLFSIEKIPVSYCNTGREIMSQQVGPGSNFSYNMSSMRNNANLCK